MAWHKEKAVVKSVREMGAGHYHVEFDKSIRGYVGKPTHALSFKAKDELHAWQLATRWAEVCRFEGVKSLGKWLDEVYPERQKEKNLWQE